MSRQTSIVIVTTRHCRFHEALLRHPDFEAGMATTRWVEDIFLPERAALRRRA
jgi:hypothetical protein